MKFYCIKTCGSCRKGKNWLDENKIAYTEIDLKKEAPSEKELLSAIKKSKLEPRTFLNTSGKLYREMNLKERAATLSREEVAKLLSENPMLIKRPLLVDDDRVLVGFSEESYGALL